jgi:hypothetical protein
MPTKLLFLPLLLVSALFLAACSSEGKKFPETLVIGDNDVLPIMANTEIVVGPNRFALGLIDPDGFPIFDAKVHLTFYDLNDGETKRHEVEAVSRVPARDAGITEEIIHIHPDGTRHSHFNVGEQVGIYTARVDFDRPGWWGVEIKLESGDLKRTLRPRFNVLERGSTPPIGADAPRSRNLTVYDVDDITRIDTSSKPSADMHTATIADTIEAGKPALVLFAVPGYCTSRLCGPVMEIMRKLHPRFQDQVEFIHVEFYNNPGTPNAQPVDAVKEWNLRSEPWFFVIDAKGKVADKFEGPISMQELEESLRAVIASASR